jgi:hypothetical protein
MVKRSRRDDLHTHTKQMNIKKVFLTTGLIAATGLMTACGDSRPTLSRVAVDGYTKCVVESKRAAARMYEAEMASQGYSIKDMMAGLDCKSNFGIDSMKDVNDYRIVG